VNFLMLAAVLFVIVKFIVRLGIGRGRVFGEKQCPYCLETVAPTALVCKACGQPLVDELPPLAEAERLLAQAHARRRISLPSLPTRPTLPRRPGDVSAAGAPGAAAGTGAAAGAAATTFTTSDGADQVPPEPRSPVDPG
jgi:hypothetical protein